MQLKAPNYNSGANPNGFQLIKSPCLVNRGFVLKDVHDPTDVIACEVTAKGDWWLIEIYNFGTYQGDGWFIIEMDITNPPTEVWTGPWEALTFDNKPVTDYDHRFNDHDDTGYTRVIDGRPDYSGTGNAEGRTWVGESATAPNLFRVVRNRESYEERRAK